MVNGMAEISYMMPVGDNLVIGTKEDFESQSVFFALWNSNNDHGIYRIQGEAIDLVIGGEILNFDENSDVSITIIDGKIYWTDNINQPRMVNIAKGIANLYPTPLEEWMITQIKRPPANYLITNVLRSGTYEPTDFTLDEASVDYDNLFTNPNGFQFAYYYVYDNNEESRLSPVTPMNWWTADLRLQVPDTEFVNYLNNLNLVKQVVFCFRIGNDGIWYAIKRVDNISANYVNGTIQCLIPNVTLLPKTAVTSEITSADFDSVPLLSVSNEVAQNRLNHGNYLIDYPNWTGLTLDVTVENFAPAADGQQRTLKPGGIYNVGIELLDQWGRKIGVVNAQQIQVPNYTKWYYAIGDGQFVTQEEWDVNFGIGNALWGRDRGNNTYRFNFTISGELPTWAASFRFVYSKVIDVVDSQRTNVKMWVWYSKGGVDYLSEDDRGLYGLDRALGYIRQGLIVELTSGEPFLIDNGTTSFVNIIGLYGLGFAPAGFQTPPSGWNKEYQISKQVNNFLFIPIARIGSFLDILPPLGFTHSQPNPGNPGFPTSYVFDVELLKKSNSVSEIYYQTTSIFFGDGEIFETGTVNGDYYLNKFIRLNLGTTQQIIFNRFFTTFEERSVVVYGTMISRNPTNIYSQIWNSDIGQANVVNENQRQKRILQGILFSDALIQGTQINGLSKFNSIDNRQAPLENGPIVALVRTNATQREPGVLLAIGKNAWQSFYYDGIQLTNVDGTSNVSTSDRYLASQRPLLGNYGVDKLRSICVTPLGTVYAWSEAIKDWVRYTSGGLEQLGETYQFQNYVRNQLNGSTSIMMTYDQVTDEAIVVGDSSDAFVFSERDKTFQGSREYRQGVNDICPERGATLATRTYFFLEGHVWQMGPDVAVATGSFFGERKSPRITVITNEQPTITKQWNGIVMYGPRPTTTQLNTETPDGADSGLSSVISEGWWINRKSNWMAAVRKDENSVGGVMNGKPMESRILISTFAWDPNDFVRLNYIQINSNISIIQ